MFYAFNKIVLIAVYAAAAASFLMPTPFDGAHWVRIIVGVLLVAHTLEAVVFFKKVSLHKGPVIDSLVLTLLFGFLHWKPLADAAGRR